MSPVLGVKQALAHPSEPELGIEFHDVECLDRDARQSRTDQACDLV